MVFGACCDPMLCVFGAGSRIKCPEGNEVLWRQSSRGVFGLGLNDKVNPVPGPAGRGQGAGGWLQMEHQINSSFL